MSGEKRRYVRVEEQELRRLREQESRLRSVQQDLPERLNAVREEARREFQQRLAPLDQRTSRQEQEAQKLKSSLKDLEINTNRRLQQQRQELQTAVREAESRQQQEYTQLIAQQDQKFTGLLQQERRSRERGQQIIQQQIAQVVDNLEQERKRKAQLAQDLFCDVEIGVLNNWLREYG